MDPFQLEDDGLDPKNILVLHEGLHMKGQIKHIGFLLSKFLYDFSRFKTAWLDYKKNIITKKVTSHYYFFYES